MRRDGLFLICVVAPQDKMIYERMPRPHLIDMGRWYNYSTPIVLGITKINMEKGDSDTYIYRHQTINMITVHKECQHVVVSLDLWLSWSLGCTQFTVTHRYPVPVFLHHVIKL